MPLASLLHRPLPSTGVTWLHLDCEPLRYPSQPGLSIKKQQKSTILSGSREESAIVPGDRRWDATYQVYAEVCTERNIKREIGC